MFLGMDKANPLQNIFNIILERYERYCVGWCLQRHRYKYFRIYSDMAELHWLHNMFIWKWMWSEFGLYVIGYEILSYYIVLRKDGINGSHYFGLLLKKYGLRNGCSEKRWEICQNEIKMLSLRVSLILYNLIKNG